jgi:hypothetical protein
MYRPEHRSFTVSNIPQTGTFVLLSLNGSVAVTMRDINQTRALWTEMNDFPDRTGLQYYIPVAGYTSPLYSTNMNRNLASYPINAPLTSDYIGNLADHAKGLTMSRTAKKVYISWKGNVGDTTNPWGYLPDIDFTVDMVFLSSEVL